MSWFSDIYGFEESTYARTQAKFCIDGPLLHTRGQSSRTFHAGILTMPSLAELRKAVCSLEVSGGERIKLSSLVADAYELHRWPEANRAIIQVASQFNLLEMPNEHTTPEKGITNYQYDYTQGPSCAMACAAATVFRNYLVPVGADSNLSTQRSGGHGQSHWHWGDPDAKWLRSSATGYGTRHQQTY
ncbi:Uncharacterised protein [Klebsiella pneumoniae]|nr:Uncharacterised protein [Klebsiella pneumoniae]